MIKLNIIKSFSQALIFFSFLSLKCYILQPRGRYEEIEFNAFSHRRRG